MFCPSIIDSVWDKLYFAFTSAIYIYFEVCFVWIAYLFFNYFFGVTTRLRFFNCYVLSNDLIFEALDIILLFILSLDPLLRWVLGFATGLRSLSAAAAIGGFFGIFRFVERERFLSELFLRKVLTTGFTKTEDCGLPKTYFGIFLDAFLIFSRVYLFTLIFFFINWISPYIISLFSFFKLLSDLSDRSSSAFLVLDLAGTLKSLWLIDVLPINLLSIFLVYDPELNTFI